MSDGLVTIYRCPYCPAGRGVVAVDPAEIRWRVREDRVRTGPGRMDSVVLDPDRVAAGPCHHLILLEVEAGWLEETHRGDCREVSYRHPALAAADPDYALNHFLWWILRKSPRGVFAPSIPFRHVHENTGGVVLGRPDHAAWEWFASFDALYAADAARFVEECRVQDARLRAL